MTDHVVRVAKRPAERQDDAPLERFCDTAGTFAEFALDCVGLLEIDV